MSEYHVPALITPGAITEFRPQEFKTRQAKWDAVIALAAKLHDWPLLDEAIEAKVDEQQTLVAWWDGDDGVQGAHRPATVADRGQLSVRDAYGQTGITKQQISRWRTSLENPDAYREKLRIAAYRKAGLEPEINRHSVETGENEWFTPSQYIEAAREVMGDIDLDPASHEIAQQTVRATQYFTAVQNGLAQPWHGRVWLNPPYEAGLVDKFVAKLLAEHSVGRMTEGVLLTHNNTDTRWFHSAAYQARLLCFTLGRIRFVGMNGEQGDAPTQGHTFFYFGPNADRFALTFGTFGFVR